MSKTWKVRLTDNTTEEVEAHKMTQNGAGLFFYDENGEMISSYNDGTHNGASLVKPNAPALQQAKETVKLQGISELKG